MTERGLSQKELATAIGEKQQTVSAWRRQREPKLDDLRKIEVALRLPAGHFVRLAGYVPPEVPVEDMILSDDRLPPAERSLLSRTYRLAIESSPAARAKPVTRKRARS